MPESTVVLETLTYLDIHTHRRGSNDTDVSVASLSLEEIRSGETHQEYSSAGIHPWWLEDISPEDTIQLKKQIESLARNGRLWGIGESGLDRLYPEFLDLQKELFAWHLELAESCQLPLFIHNVRSGSDFLEILKKHTPTIPWIFHDFRGNQELVEGLLKLHPQCYFSFGISLDNSPQVRELLPFIPLENLFLETDNQKHLDIHDIYLRAADQLKLDLEFLKAQIWHNFKKVSRHLQ